MRPIAVVAMAALSAAVAAPPPAAAQEGEAAFAACSICHSLEPGRNGVGPSLHGVVGRRKASEPGYSYSAALKAKGGVWTTADLDAFLADPSGWAPGTKMGYPGVKSPEKRAALIAYLKTKR